MSGGPFDDLPVVGVLSRNDAAVKLREVEEDTAADALEEAARTGPARFG